MLIGNYILADLIVQIKKAITCNEEYTYVVYTKLNLKVLNILLNEGCIKTFYVDYGFDNLNIKNRLYIKIKLSYIDNKPVMKKIKLVSKPGLRIYWNNIQLYKHINKCLIQGFYIISTVNGLFSSNFLLSSQLDIKNKLNKLLPVSGEILVKVNL